MWNSAPQRTQDRKEEVIFHIILITVSNINQYFIEIKIIMIIMITFSIVLLQSLYKRMTVYYQKKVNIQMAHPFFHFEKYDESIEDEVGLCIILTCQK